MYQLISDGGCDFTMDEAANYNVNVVPFYIGFDDNTHLKEGVDISKADFFQRLASEKGLYPKTSQPSPQDYINAITPHLEEERDVILLTISSKLSGSYNSAVLAADILKEDYPNRTVLIIDSLNASVGQGLIFREMIKMRDAGQSINETARLTEKVLKSTKIYFTLDTLEYLKKGGRVGPTTALVGGILGLRPILQVVDGQVSQLDNVRGKKRALELIEEAMVDVLKDETDNIDLSIGHVLSEAEAEAFKKSTEKALNMEITNPVTEIGAAIGTHTGPGALAFSYCRKYECFLSESGQNADESNQERGAA